MLQSLDVNLCPSFWFLLFDLVSFFFVFPSDGIEEYLQRGFARRHCHQLSSLSAKCFSRLESPHFRADKGVGKVGLSNSQRLQFGVSGALRICRVSRVPRFLLVLKSLVFFSKKRAAEHSVRIRHKSPDVARLMLVHYENATHVSLYCWHSSLHEFFSPEIKSITLISSAPMINLPNLPRTLEELMVWANRRRLETVFWFRWQVHDPAVTDNSVMIALGRSGRTMSNLKVAD